ncbi:hypothetical protein C5167_005337 [Papaver somniferum]|uniref:Uncharacterized protein n=1 Tax=Papaver somniferum TaxID=3469 RepID=A0A4Y7JB51_PAPSO|nr:hypothetical protein C5167_005337 [Papaver somniferum]
MQIGIGMRRGFVWECHGGDSKNSIKHYDNSSQNNNKGWYCTVEAMTELTELTILQDKLKWIAFCEDSVNYGPGTDADDGRGGINYLSFEYHGLPYLFCCFCHQLRHRQVERADYLQAQQLVQHEPAILFPPEFQPPLLVSEDETEDSGSDGDISSPIYRKVLPMYFLPQQDAMDIESGSSQAHRHLAFATAIYNS